MEEQQPGKDLADLSSDDQHKSVNQEARDNEASESRTRKSGAHAERPVDLSETHTMGNAIGEELDGEVLQDTMDRQLESDDDSVFETDHEEPLVTSCHADDVQRRKSSGVNSSLMSHSSTNRPVEPSSHRSHGDVEVNPHGAQPSGDRQQRSECFLSAGPSGLPRDMQPRLSTPSVPVSGFVRTRTRALTINDPNDVIQEVARSLIDLSLDFDRRHAARPLSAQRQNRSSSVSDAVGSYFFSVAGVASNLVSSVSNTLQFVRRTSSQLGVSLRNSLRRNSLSALNIQTRLHVSRSAGSQLANTRLPYDAHICTSSSSGGIIVDCDRPAELSAPITSAHASAGASGEARSSETHAEHSQERPVDSLQTQQSVTNQSSSSSSTITECDAERTIAEGDSDESVGDQR